MGNINFPTQYKSAILSHKKQVTIRVGEEIGKYKVGRTYTTTTYSGISWGIKCHVDKIIQTTVAGLAKYGIPNKSINSLIKTEKLKSRSLVEIIWFSYPDK